MYPSSISCCYLKTENFFIFVRSPVLTYTNENYYTVKSSEIAILKNTSTLDRVSEKRKRKKVEIYLCDLAFCTKIFQHQYASLQIVAFSIVLHFWCAFPKSPETFRATDFGHSAS